MANREVLMHIDHLTREFKTHEGVVHAVSDVSFDLYRGDTLALVGESGCGKSTLGRLLLRLIPATRGTVTMNGKDLSALKGNALREMRRDMQLVFQDPYASLDPRKTVRSIICEPLRAFRVPVEEQGRILSELASRVGIDEAQLDRYPHQFSGGQRQRIGIARALALHPSLIVCDEPVSALDVSIQAQILNLLNELQAEYQLTYLFISHDLNVVRHIANRVCVMFLGKICEIGDATEIFENPMHPYTHFLLAATPVPDPDAVMDSRDLLKGEIPSPMHPPEGCRFHTRCPYARPICTRQAPELNEINNGRLCACHFPGIAREERA